jgi:hypothetical protein
MSTEAEYLSAIQAAQMLGISRALFFARAGEYRQTAGRSGFGPAVYFSSRCVRYRRADLNRCAARYVRGQEATQEATA